jgi:hypothetical protein
MTSQPLYVNNVLAASLSQASAINRNFVSAARFARCHPADRSGARLEQAMDKGRTLFLSWPGTTLP